MRNLRLQGLQVSRRRALVGPVSLRFRSELGGCYALESTEKFARCSNETAVAVAPRVESPPGCPTLVPFIRAASGQNVLAAPTSDPDEIRKRLVEFDDVINEHRTVIYGEREKILRGVDTRANVVGMLIEELESLLKNVSMDPDSLEVLRNELLEILPAGDVPSITEMQDLGEELSDEVLDRAEDRYEDMEANVGEEAMRRVEHWLLIESIDTHWREHLTAIDDLRQSIGLQAYAQVDPLVAFKREGHDMYQQLVQNIQRQVARTLFKVRIVQQDNAAPVAQQVEPSPGDIAAAQAAAAAGNGNGNGAKEGRKKVAAPVLAKSSGPSDDQIRTLGGNGQNAPKGKGSNAAKRRKMIR